MWKKVTKSTFDFWCFFRKCWKIFFVFAKQSPPTPFFAKYWPHLLSCICQHPGFGCRANNGPHRTPISLWCHVTTTLYPSWRMGNNIFCSRPPKSVFDQIVVILIKLKSKAHSGWCGSSRRGASFSGGGCTQSLSWLAFYCRPTSGSASISSSTSF